ncbi:uncharacterized protein LODBEIA_P53130 [Lodderomyces beijingensis]|uniref:Serine/threonine-protein phosphatase 2A activator n=1 Tax=Lodderomyces beijingensis TaxID=1775926 RepID=A0ABP0ZT68_9ASCO
MAVKPVSRVYTKDDLDCWVDSETYREVVEFVCSLQEAVVGKANDDAGCLVSSQVQRLVSILESINEMIDLHPVEQEKGASRFGKVEFRDFYSALGEQCPELVKRVSGEANIELATYLQESWGDSNRIDYGSGHELNFVSFLLSLCKLGTLRAEDFPALVLKVFTKYMAIMRRLQKTYWLEPAGSHGVWGLDDYHFLPFLFGAAQLSQHPHMRPKSIHNDELVELYKDKYIYFECIDFVNKIKTSTKQEKLSLRWHSPMLDDISSAKSWEKIKEGMVKMYKAGVLGKLPIIQHFLFGSILKCPAGIPERGEADAVERCRHSRDVVNTWGDCCGIKIPSAIAASESVKREERRAVPFD